MHSQNGCSILFLLYISASFYVYFRRLVLRKRLKEKENSMLLHKCRCGKLISQEIRLCEECEKKATARHTEYNEKRRDKKKAAFYVSAAWRKVRAVALQRFDRLDIYAYYMQDKIAIADMVHHIVPVEDDWERRLDVDNLIPLSNSNHNIIEALYSMDDETKKDTQKMLRQLVTRYKKQEGG